MKTRPATATHARVGRTPRGETVRAVDVQPEVVIGLEHGDPGEVVDDAEVRRARGRHDRDGRARRRHLLRDRGRELRDIATLAGAQDAAAARLRRVLDTLLDGSRDDITLMWVQARALGTRNEVLAARVREQMDAWQSMLEAEILRGVEAGEFPAVTAPDDAAAIDWHLLAMIDVLNAHSLVRWGQHPDPAALAKRSLAGLLGVDPAVFG